MPPAFRALLLMVAAASAVGLAATRLPMPLWAAVAAIGLLAGGSAWLLRMDRWWPPLLVALPAAVMLSLRLPIPAWAWGTVGLAMLAVYGSVFRSQVPLFLSRRDVWDAVLALLPEPRERQRLRFVDLGSGLGGLPRFIGRHRRDVDCDGVELAPLPALFAAVRSGIAPLTNVRLRRGSLWDYPLGRTDVAFAFLSPVPMADLWRKASSEMRAGTLFVSCEFAVPEVTPDAVIPVRRRSLYLYRI